MSLVAWLLFVAGGFHNAPAVVFVAVPIPHPADGLVAVSILVSAEDLAPVGVDVNFPFEGFAFIWREIPGPRPGPRGPNGEPLPPRRAPRPPD
ncbi:MAG: hypothetical protein IT428_26295 [Planctomycetaceae bacterium]|nr:hypothetical protein [Planctomycetaceae bacterium]